MGGGAAWDIDLQAGDDNIFEFVRLGTGNIRVDASCNHTVLETTLGTTPTITNGANSTIIRTSPGKLGGVKSINSGTVIGNNRGGSVTISGVATTGVVTFSTAEPDANYRVVGLAVESVSGAPAASSFIASVAQGTRTVNGFTINLNAAPGGGTSVSVAWTIER